MKKDSLTEQNSPQAQDSEASIKPIVVGIGASAGGLAALKRLFERMPAECGMAFVVVVHLSPEHKSHLADLLQPSVRFPVRQVTETNLLEPNNVYVIPPNANLSAIDTHLRLSKLEEHRRERAPIDHFFRTLASTHDGHSIGVILTGTGSDGTLGLKEIKAKGGLILVQDPNEAEYDGMPQSAIATGQVDRILPLAEIPQVLLRLAHIGPRIVIADEDYPTQPERLLLPKVLAILKSRTDRDFSRYKPATMLRRIARRMQLNYIDTFDGYLERLREQTDEVRALADDLLITVTSFFRDADVFHKLESDVIPKLFEGKGAEDNLRVWTVGCATGEEAYSVAMLLIEEATRRADPPRLQVFASDLHKRSLDGAREGLYPGDIETDVAAARLKRFFHRENGGYRINKEVRDTVVFAPHNLLGDPPFSRLDLITCRNLLIYLDRAVQRDVIDLFHYALCPHGYLLLGSAETIDAPELYLTEDKKLCLYQKRNVPAPEPRLPVFPLTRLRAGGEHYTKAESIAAAIPYQSLHQNLLEQYAPPSILVGPDNRLVHLSDHAGKYLVHPGGEVTSSVLRLVREELRIELQSLLQTAREKKELLDSKPISVRFNGHSTPIVMHVRPAQDAEREGFVLVIFDERHAEPENSGDANTALGEEAKSELAAKRVAELESELTAARQHLQAIIEEYETGQEEMKASNEEMQSTNEELRSTMEELETSKEELQSINEELQTVNQENRHKVEELSQLSGDLQNLLSATDIATLFLDRELRIMRFTPRLAELFSVRVTDRGRPISDLTHRLGYEQLCPDAQAVLNRLVPIEREIRDDAGRWYLTRVLPYRSTADRIDGAVITFTEITSRKLAEEAVRRSEEQYRALFLTMDEGFCTIEVLFDESGKAVDYVFLETNPAFVRQGRMENVVGKRMRELKAGHEEFWFETYGEIAKSGEAKHFEHEAAAVGGYYQVHAFRIGTPEEHQIGVIFSDITERRRAEAVLRASEERQAFLLKLSDAVRPLADPVEIKAKATRILGEHLGANHCYYAEIDLESGYATIEEDYYVKTSSVAGRYITKDYGKAVLAGLRAGRTVVCVDVANNPEMTAEEKQLYAELHIAAYVFVPMVKSETLSSVLAATSSKPREWTHAEIFLVEQTAERTWAAVEHARAEMALRETQERLQRVLETDAVAVLFFSREGALKDANEVFLRMTGYSRDEVSTGRLTWQQMTPPEWLAASQEQMDRFLVSGRIGPYEKEYIRKDGTRSWMLFAGRDLGDGTIVEFGVNIEDRMRAEKALQESESQLRLFVENVQEYALVQTNPEGAITNWNPGAQRLFGYDAEQMLGRNFSILLTPEDAKAGLFAHELAKVASGQRNEDARWFVRQDGTRFWARWISEPISDSTGEFRGLAKIMRDETERERAAALTKHSLAEKEELLKEIHHRVKNNLQVIISLLNMQTSQIRDEQVVTVFQETRNRVLAISSIHELLYRAESLANIVLAEYARQLAPGLVRFYGLQERVRVEIAGGGTTLELERAVPYGILLNELISNACKHAFSDGRSGTITISIHPDNDDIVLTVADTGPGLPKGFDYKKASSLGLKLVHGLVRQLRGAVEISSDPGTTVRVRFPKSAFERDD